MKKTKAVDAKELLRGERSLEYMPVQELVGADRNPKLHDEANLAKSLGRFGYTEPILMDERTKKLVAGHGRLQALIHLRETGGDPPEGVILDNNGSWLVPVIRGWASRSDEDAESYLIASNQLTIAGGWDNGALGKMLLELSMKDPLNIVGLGFDDKLLTKLLDSSQPKPQASVEDIPEKIGSIFVERGHVYRLGEHVLGCGDSTDEAMVSLVLGDGDRPALVFTDPPYGIAYKAMRGGDAIANDESEEAARSTLLDALAFGHTAEAAFVCCDWRSLEMTRQAMVGTGFEPKACIVWDKKRGVQNLDRFHKQHELILYAGPYGGQTTVCGDVWQCARDFDPAHPTPKPVELVQKAIEAASLRGAIVYEPFSGSGSTLMACEVSGRRCRAIELEPKYVQLALVRWQTFTGRQAERVA